jgi:glucose-6-phosphate 1-epimerase
MRRMSETASVQQLNERFGVDGTVRFEPGNGGLVRAVITTPAAEAQVYLHGAHVTHYQPRGQRPVLFTSAHSAFEAGKPIRGGVPVCLPWFAVKEDDPSAPMHGFARTAEWTVESTRRVDEQRAAITLRFDATPEPMRKFWPHDFVARFTATVGPELAMELAVSLPQNAKSPMTFTEALHTYFAVGDTRQASVAGLENTEYFDKVIKEPARQGDAPVRFTGETDRVFFGTRATCVIDDPVLKRRVTVEKSGSDATVVWNPWIDRAKALADVGDEEWTSFVCVETANTKQCAITVQPGQTHTVRQVIRVAPR